jgi:transcriptional regulator with XRE-family HTH domain
MLVENKTDTLKILFGKNIRLARFGLGLSQQKLSNAIGISHNFLNDIEKGRKGVSFDTIAKLAQALSVEPYKLFLPAKENNSTKYPDHIEYLLKASDAAKEFYLNNEQLS